jgi:hypothetical protein
MIDREEAVRPRRDGTVSRSRPVAGTGIRGIEKFADAIRL